MRLAARWHLAAQIGDHASAEYHTVSAGRPSKLHLPSQSDRDDQAGSVHILKAPSLTPQDGTGRADELSGRRT